MKIELPKDWNSVTIVQFIQLSKVKKDEEDPLAIEPLIEMLSILSGQPRQELYKVKFTDLVGIWKVLGWMSELNFKEELVKEFTINGVTYCANLDVSKMSADQYMDYRTYMKGGKSIDNLHNILSVFYIPKGETYNQTSSIEIADIFLNELSIAVAYPLQVFFCNRLKKWNDLLQDSSAKKKTPKKGIDRLKRMVKWNSSPRITAGS